MPPLLACFPVCLTFAIMTVFGVMLLILGVGRNVPIPPPEPREPSTVIRRPLPAVETGPPPWWVFVAVLVATVAVLLALSTVTEG